MGDARVVGTQIRMRLPSLTPLESKLAKKPGFAGFRDPRQGLVNYHGTDTVALHSEIGAQDTAGRLVRKVFANAVLTKQEL